MASEAHNENGLIIVKFENQKVPEFKQVRGKDWVYWGEKNDYPDYLIELYMRSSTHNAIITGKVNYIIGNGWKADKAGLTVTNNAILNAFINKINHYETLNELCESVILDFEIFNGIALEVIWNKSGQDFELFHIPFNKIRTNENQSKYYYSKDWTSVNQSEEKTGLKEYEPFDENVRKGSSIFVYQITSPRKGKDPNVYSMPEYIGSTQAIETDLECSNYNLSEIKTGFSAGTILNFYNGIPDNEAKKVIEKQIREKFSGTDRAGSIIINFADGKDRGSEALQISGNDLDKRYIELKKDVRQEIFTGHKVSSPMLFGVKTEGQLGGRNEIAEAYELFQNTYISRRQNIIEKIFNKFSKLKGIQGKLVLQPTSAINVNVFTEQTIVENLPAKAIQDLIAERMGIDLSKYNNTPVITNTVNTITEMNAQKRLIEKKILIGFSKIGRSRDLFNIYRKKELKHLNHFSAASSEVEYFKNELTSQQRSVIDLLNKDEKMPSTEIAKTLKLTTKEVNLIIENLIEEDYLKPTKVGYIPSSNAIDVIEREGAKTANIEVLYSYELRSNAPKLQPGGTSRDFCKDMVKLDLLYTRSEIDSLSNGMGLDVWTYKGGWYTNPNTDAPTPQCRHIWVQNITKLK
jgi:DNA-binding Lrp family transcriptional regulator